MDTNFKVYVCDFGWMGNIVVISDSEENALKLMGKYDNYERCLKECRLPEIEVFDISEGVVYCSYGDI